MASILHDTFLNLVRLGIGHSAYLSAEIDWNSIETLAEQQGLSAILVDGLERLPKEKRPPQESLLQWKGLSLQDEERYICQRKTSEKIATLFL